MMEHVLTFVGLTRVGNGIFVKTRFAVYSAASCGSAPVAHGLPDRYAFNRRRGCLRAFRMPRANPLYPWSPESCFTRQNAAPEMLPSDTARTDRRCGQVSCAGHVEHGPACDGWPSKPNPTAGRAIKRSGAPAQSTALSDPSRLILRV
jgi:hypothetical protein